MKKIFNCLIFALCGVFLLIGSANAATYTFDDVYKNWPGQNYPAALANVDEHGNPKIDQMIVTTDGNNNLQSVVLSMKDRLVFDSLFINTGGDNGTWESWDYYVRDTNLNDTGAALYGVAPNYQYTYATVLNERYGHANGIDSNYLSPDNAGLLSGVQWFNDGNSETFDPLIYTFNAGIVLGEGWSIGYTPYCANDVFLAPVPEPATMALLGIGLLGLAGISRRKRS